MPGAVQHAKSRDCSMGFGGGEYVRHAFIGSPNEKSDRVTAPQMVTSSELVHDIVCSHAL